MDMLIAVQPPVKASWKAADDSSGAPLSASVGDLETVLALAFGLA